MTNVTFSFQYLVFKTEYGKTSNEILPLTNRHVSSDVLHFNALQLSNV